MCLYLITLIDYIGNRHDNIDNHVYVCYISVFKITKSYKNRF